MPEAPEVESVRLGLLTLVGQEFTHYELIQNSMWEKDSLDPEVLIGQKIESIVRHGKYLQLKTQHYLWFFHLGMSGVLILKEDSEEWRAHTHFCFTLGHQFVLAYSDPRRFGFHCIYKIDESVKRINILGYDALDKNWTTQDLFSKISKSSRAIKILLLDQSIVAGIGNIYDSEILFACKIHPLRTGQSITLSDCENIVLHTQRILLKSIENRGTTFSDYRLTNGKGGEFQSFLQVFQKENEPCPNCAKPILKGVMGGRSHFYCGLCQV
jgi:formamidopyrimidine-DNA glycosylase